MTKEISSSVKDRPPVECFFKATARIHPHLCTHFVFWCRIVILPKLHIPQVAVQVWNSHQEHHEMLMCRAMDEKLPQCQAF
ncbi:unnamed protein product [Prunus armeniaca]|uniref:Uncharacterized protein n=1 Tax=Prunus armeniaca TaxID=36596 RepID=A0A6J5WVB8_PRUAR|nr:unnamed protein product [Prunus armeniaca]CAB4303632.1 unnamed protein product [Prunus armeniaca]